MDYYRSKITNHLGYIVTSTLAIGSILFQTSTNFKNFILILSVLGVILFYFVGRIIYWTRLTGAIYIVKPYDEENLKRVIKSLGEHSEMYEYNLLLAFHETCIKFVHRQDVFKNEPKNNF